MEALTNTKHCSQNFNNYSVQISLFLYSQYFGLGPDAARTQYLTHTAPNSSLSLWRRKLPRCFAAPLQALSLVSTRIGRWWTPESLAILPLSRRGMAPSPSAVAVWQGSLAIRWTPAVSLYYRPVSARRTHEGWIPWVDCVVICWTLAYIALSHFSNVGHSSRQHYPSLSLEHTIRLWWSSTLECSFSFSQGIVAVAVPLTGMWCQRLQRLHTARRCGFPS